MTPDAKTNKVTDRSSLHRYRTEIPNMLLEMDLSVYAMRLYLQIKKIAGDDGKCFYSTRELAEQCRMGTGSVSRAKQELVDRDLIRVERDSVNDRDNITIVDLWPANFAHFARESEPPCSPQEQPRSTGEHRVPTGNSRVPQGNTIYKDKEEPLKEEPGEEENAAALNPKQELYAAICDALGWDYTVIAEEDKCAAAEAVTALHKSKYTVADIRRFMVEIWFHDWRWEKDRKRPTLKQLRQEIGNLRAKTPETVPRRDSGAMSEEKKAALRTRAQLARKSLESATKFKTAINPEWQQTIDMAKAAGVI